MIYQNHTNYNCEIVLDNGERYQVFSQWLANEGLHNWKGWECNVGHTRMLIVNDEVYGGQCRQDHLGNLNTGWEILKTPTVCRQNTCTLNTDDLVVAKRKINED